MSIKPLRPADLTLDLENPRLADEVAGQREALRTLASLDPNHLITLAKDIIKHGMNPSELPIVIPAPSGNKYLVLEGNRRLSVLRALDNPTVLDGAVSTTIAAAMKRLSIKYHANPVEELYCYVANSREEANHWIELRHTGQNEGAGIVRWLPAETSRFKTRNGTLEPFVQVIDLLEQEGILTASKRRTFPETTLQRMIKTPEISPMLGLSFENGELSFTSGKNKTLAVLRKIVKDLSSGDQGSRSLNRKPERIKYISELPESIKPPNPKPSSAASKTKLTKHSTGSATKGSSSRTRDYVIPSSCTLHIGDERVNDIAIELRKLSLKQFCNSCAVLLRVFIELSADHYIVSQHLSTVNKNTKLRLKVIAVIEHLVSQGVLSEEQAKPMRHMCLPDSFLGIALLHLFVHDNGAYPEPAALRATWNTLQPTIQAIWS